jgi:hypothetical protein
VRFGYAGEVHTRGAAVFKKLLEILLCILHPIAVVLIWIYLLFGRGNMGFIARIAWGVAVIVPFVPFLYVFTGNDFI